MGRKVFITGDMSIDEKLIAVAEQDPQAALLWPWLLTVFDDWGRAEANPRRLKAQIFPMNTLITVELIETALRLYAQQELLQIYEVAGKLYMAIPQSKWYKYQTHMHRERRPGKDKMASNFPDPPEINTPHGDARGCAGENGGARVPVPSPSPSPSPSRNIYAPDGASAQPETQNETAASQDPGDQAVNDSLADGVEADKVTVQQEREPVGNPGEQRPRTPFKSRKQEEMFDAFWREYPRRRAKGNAEKAWVKISPSEQLFEVIMDGLKLAKTSADWIKDGGKYIPYPASWLNAKCWEDEYTHAPVSQAKPRAEPKGFAGIREFLEEGGSKLDW